MKATKSAKKHFSSFHTFDPLVTARSVIALLIITIAASVFVLFALYKENIILNNMYYPFMILTFVVMALLVSLLFLVNPHHPKKK